MAIAGRIHRLAQIIQLRSDTVLAENGITRAEFDVLSLPTGTGGPIRYPAPCARRMAG